MKEYQKGSAGQKAIALIFPNSAHDECWTRHVILKNSTAKTSSQLPTRSAACLFYLKRNLSRFFPKEMRLVQSSFIGQHGQVTVQGQYSSETVQFRDSAVQRQYSSKAMLE